MKNDANNFFTACGNVNDLENYFTSIRKISDFFTVIYKGTEARCTFKNIAPL